MKQKVSPAEVEGRWKEVREEGSVCIFTTSFPPAPPQQPKGTLDGLYSTLNPTRDPKQRALRQTPVSLWASVFITTAWKYLHQIFRDRVRGDISPGLLTCWPQVHHIVRSPKTVTGSLVGPGEVACSCVTDSFAQSTRLGPFYQ